MDDLVTWLRAQLDEDERLAQAAADRYPVWSATEDGTVCQEGTGGSGYLATGPYGELFEVGHHMARHDPARVLREVEAKRRIVDRYVRDINSDHWEARLAADSFGEEALRLLAAPYADRPGYRDEWRP